MSTPVIKAEGLGKEYLIGAREAGRETFREMLTSSFAAPFRRFRRLSGEAAPEERIWALKDVSFEVAEGEVVGIIGRNGAGKSTLLKILSRITEPTEGRALIRGRVASLLEVGTGFHPELTGRENIRLNGAILGMSRAEIDRKFDEIVAFAEVEKFLDTPVKRYSSGMAVRLAFAVAAHLDPEILLVDEVLAVGDAAFQKKCLGKMQEVSGQGRTVLFVSHNMATISGLCSRSMLLIDGKFVHGGLSEDVIQKYLSIIEDVEEFDLDSLVHYGTGTVKIKAVSFENYAGDKQRYFLPGKNCRIRITVSTKQLVKRTTVQIGIHNHLDQRLGNLDSAVKEQTFDLLPEKSDLICDVDSLPLFPGRYSIKVAILKDREVLDGLATCGFFMVEQGDFYGTGKLPGYGPILFNFNWRS